MQKEQEIFNHVLNHLGNVKYDDEDEKIKNDFSAFFTLVPKILNMHYTSDIPEYGDLFQPLAMASTLVKHHGFREEREVRIVVAPMSQYSK